MIVAIVLMSLALTLYTVAIFTERRIGHLETWIVSVFVGGFVCDLIGTSTMFLLSKAKFSIALHSVCGYLALLIMLAHLVWAILSLKDYGNCQRHFTKYSIYAWAVWIVAFISGIPKSTH